MSEEKAPDPVSAIIKPITDITVSVGAVMAYIQGIFKIAETPIPNTFSLLLILSTSVIVISRRWGKLNEKKKNSTKNGTSKSTAKGSFIERLFEPLKESKRDPYALSLPRRRFEAGFIAALTVFTLGWSGVNASAVVTELTSTPGLTCSPSDGENNLLIVVADVKETGGQQLLVSSKIYNELVNNQAGSSYNVCRIKEAYEINTDALKKAQELRADIIIWGTRDAVSYEMHLEAPAFTDHDRSISDEAAEEAVSREFQVKEVSHIAYVAEFTLSEILLLQGHVQETQIQLKDALDRARVEKVPPSQMDLADGYYLLGLLYDPRNSEYSDAEKAVNAYGEAEALNENLHAARLNRGLILGEMGRVDEAIAEYAYLIDNNTPLKGDALINRTLLLTDPAERISGFEAAVKIDPVNGYLFLGGEYLEQENYTAAIKNLKLAIQYDPEFFLNYHLLGLSQLYAGEYEAAKETYKLMIPYLIEEDRQAVIQELEEKAKSQPKIQPTVQAIIQQLQGATLP